MMDSFAYVIYLSAENGEFANGIITHTKLLFPLKKKKKAM